MSLGGGKSQSTTDVRLAGININQSNYGNAIPLLYGKNRVAMTLLWYGNWVATPHTQTQSGGKGGGGGSSNTTYTYSASMIMALIEGPMGGPMGQVWQDKAITTLAALGLTLFNGAGGQATWSYLTTNFPSQAVPYDHTAYVAIANMSLGSSTGLPNYTFEPIGFKPYNVGTIDDAEPSDILIDYCTDANHGANFSALGSIQGVGNTYQTYCIAMGLFLSPYETTQRAAVDFIKETLQITNSNGWMSAGVLKIQPYADQAVTGNSRTYTPTLTPLFAFTDDDLMPGSGSASGSDPIIVDRKPLADTYNTVRVEFLDRANAYNTAIAEATDAQDIALNGVRVMSTLTFHSITTAPVARQVAQLILQRQLYIRNQYTFSVRPDYSLLEPMDLVSITDTALGIVNKLVRIVQIDDDANDQITIVAEEMLVGTASAPIFNWQASQGYAANYAVTPPSVGTPAIFAAPALLVSAAGGYEAWVAVDQGSAGSWGGCDVYMSLDGTSYIYAGTVNGGARYGTLTATLASHADPDTVDTLAVVLTNAATTPLQLVSGSAADYNNLRTLIYVDGEIMAYQTATLTSAGHYNLTTLRRGQYGSTPAAHLSASTFVRIDAGIFRVPFDAGMMGQTVSFKFCSFNSYGHATQSLASATAYPYVLSNVNAGQMTPGPLTLVGRGVTVNGNSVFKSASTSAWDSDVYSVQGYTNGAFVTWQPAQTTLDFMMGLNTDPLTDSSYTSLDYAMDCEGTFGGAPGTLQAYESGTGTTIGTYVAGDQLSITYDGAFVRYLKNLTLLRQTPAPPNLKFYLDSSFALPQACATNLQFGPYGPATPALWIPRGLALAADTNVHKNGGTSVWTEADCYSINSFPTCHLVWKANATTGDFMGALVTAIPATPNFTTLDYAINCQAGAGWAIYESGVNTGVAGSYTANDYFSITYDNTTLKYWKNLTVLRSVTVSLGSLFGMFDLFLPGVGVNSIEFGPTATIPLLDTPQLNADAASQIASVFSGILVNNIATVGGTNPQTITVASITITCTGAPIAIDFYCSLNGGNTGGGSCTAGSLQIFKDGVALSSSSYNYVAVVNSGSITQVPVTLSLTDVPTAASHTYTAHSTITTSGAGGAQSQVSFIQGFLKIREIKR